MTDVCYSQPPPYFNKHSLAQWTVPCVIRIPLLPAVASPYSIIWMKESPVCGGGRVWGVIAVVWEQGRLYKANKLSVKPPPQPARRTQQTSLPHLPLSIHVCLTETWMALPLGWSKTELPFRGTLLLTGLASLRSDCPHGDYCCQVIPASFKILTLYDNAKHLTSHVKTGMRYSDKGRLKKLESLDFPLWLWIFSLKADCNKHSLISPHCIAQLMKQQQKQAEQLFATLFIIITSSLWIVSVCQTSKAGLLKNPPKQNNYQYARDAIRTESPLSFLCVNTQQGDIWSPSIDQTTTNWNRGESCEEEELFLWKIGHLERRHKIKKMVLMSKNIHACYLSTKLRIPNLQIVNIPC